MQAAEKAPLTAVKADPVILRVRGLCLRMEASISMQG